MQDALPSGDVPHAVLQVRRQRVDPDRAIQRQGTLVHDHDEVVDVGYLVPFSHEGLPYFECGSGGEVGVCEFVY